MEMCYSEQVNCLGSIYKAAKMIKFNGTNGKYEMSVRKFKGEGIMCFVFGPNQNVSTCKCKLKLVIQGCD